MKIIVGGGGTGGHIFAGIAIIQEFKRLYPDGEVLFVGAKGGLEERLVPRENISLETLHLGSLKSVGMLQRLKTLIKIPFAVFKSIKIIFRFRPNAVIGVGGYASGPIVLVAKLLSPFLRTKTAILEQNAVSGFTNRILAQFVDIVFCAFPGIENQFPGKHVVLSGNPIRGNFTKAPEKSEGEPLGVFIFGGSQGAMGINTLVLESLPFLKDLSIRWVHQTGERDFDRVVEGYQKAGIPARVEKFIYEMKEAYTAADLIICRAGSSTLGELAAVQRPAFLIPFPFASDNHQEKNGRLFEERGAARVFLQGKTSPEEFSKEVRSLLLNRPLQKKMSDSLSVFHRPDSTNIIVKTILFS
jgi:UDP-N-acetylglucosamine--N-acetylmuramyl-(pentapeptide) pyrophosphoryl-undecaprenol N-acetylglucosamine transferase